MASSRTMGTLAQGTESIIAWLASGLSRGTWATSRVLRPWPLKEKASVGKTSSPPCACAPSGSAAGSAPAVASTTLIPEKWSCQARPWGSEEAERMRATAPSPRVGTTETRVRSACRNTPRAEGRPVRASTRRIRATPAPGVQPVRASTS